MNDREAFSFFGFAEGARAGRRGSACGRPRTLPFEQIGQSAVKRLWRQKSEFTNPSDDTPRVRTALVSDLHLGTLSDSDVLRHPHVRERLLAALDGVDRLVLLGDVLELREAPVGEILRRAQPFLDELREAFRGEVVVVPGNHDHHLVSRWLEDRGDEPLGLEHHMESELLGLPMAYPGLWLRDGVYATHGHYLDAHMTIPRIEAIAIGAVARLTRGLPTGARTPDDYESVLAPIYAFSYALAQSRTARSLGTDTSRRVWARLNGRGLGARALGGLAIPLAVAGLNRAGLGPYEGKITRQALRRSGVDAMAALVSHLGIDAEHVIFGHTHRPGPLPSDLDWQAPAGPRLVNTGSWLLETGLTAEHAGTSPYWPGTMVLVDDDGPPRVERVPIRI